MKCNKPDRLPLFEPLVRWSDFPLDTRQQVVDRLAQLWVQLQQSHTETTRRIPASTRQERVPSQETTDDQ